MLFPLSYFLYQSTILPASVISVNQICFTRRATFLSPELSLSHSTCLTHGHLTHAPSALASTIPLFRHPPSNAPYPPNHLPIYSDPNRQHSLSTPTQPRHHNRPPKSPHLPHCTPTIALPQFLPPPHPALHLPPHLFPRHTPSPHPLPHNPSPPPLASRSPSTSSSRSDATMAGRKGPAPTVIKREKKIGTLFKRIHFGPFFTHCHHCPASPRANRAGRGPKKPEAK